MTRTDDTFVELDDRVAIADRYGPNAILVSIHYNASPSSAPRGVETFFWRTDSYGLATRVQRHLIGETGLDNRGVTRRVLRLTHNPQVPSILCECGFLTNRAEAKPRQHRILPPERGRRASPTACSRNSENGDVEHRLAAAAENRPVYTRPSRQHHTGTSHRRTMAKVEQSRRRRHGEDEPGIDNDGDAQRRSSHRAR